MINDKLPTRILAYGSKITIRRLMELVISENIEICGYSQSEETLSYLEENAFDLVIVDHRAIDADAVLRTTFCFAEAPVAILIDEAITDWKKLRNLPVDGYLPDGVGSNEFLARLKTFFRRKPVYQRILTPDIRN
jgi:DNA-binding response OmpR family regulator